MATKKKLRIVVLLDETGSMASNKDETVSGFNQYLENCMADKKLSKALLTLTRFNTLDIKTEVQDMALKDVPRLTSANYSPAASTNLYDAIGITMKRLSDKLAEGESALMVIITDGEENSSSEYRKEDIRRLIQEKEAKGWGFVYLGMGFDAFLSGGAMGISLDSIARTDNDTLGVKQIYGYASQASARYAAGVNPKRLLADDIDDNS